MPAPNSKLTNLCTEPNPHPTPELGIDTAHGSSHRRIALKNAGARWRVDCTPTTNPNPTPNSNPNQVTVYFPLDRTHFWFPFADARRWLA